MIATCISGVRRVSKSSEANCQGIELSWDKRKLQKTYCLTKVAFEFVLAECSRAYL